MYIYHSPRLNCVGETLFACFLRKYFPQATYVSKSYRINEAYLNNCVETQLVIAALERDIYLPIAAKNRCLKHLNECPARLKVASNPNRISFDIVIVSEKRTFYWEFQEDQHFRLTVGRDSKVYNAENNEEIIVPRYCQRLVRDVWRTQNFDSLTIVWQDWFVANCSEYRPKLQLGLHEFSVANKFSFKHFLEIKEINYGTL